MSDHLEDQLRAELRRRAEQAPGGSLLAEQIIAAARTEPRPAGRRGWPTWSLPMLAAGAVAAIVAGVFVGVDQLRDTATPGSGQSVLNTRPPTVQNTPTNAAPTPSAGPSAVTSPTATATAANRPPDNPVGLANFRATDLTFYGTQDGWALGAADCLSGGGTCPAMVRTTDGGESWHSMPQPPGGVTGIRFATPQIGYAYSDAVLEMTTDGGRSWTAQPGGGAAVLESLDGNVVRVVDPTGSVADVHVEVAGIGSSTWTSADLPLGRYDDPIGYGLARGNGGDVYVLGWRNLPGAAQDDRSILFASTDNGARWARRGEPCPQAGGEVDTRGIAASPDGTVTALCVPRGVTDRAFVMTSTDAGATFARRPGTLPSISAEELAGDPSTVLVAAGDGAYRSTDGGASWHRIPAVSGPVTFAGFESETMGRLATDGGRTIWTTRNAGAHWTSFTFPG